MSDPAGPVNASESTPAARAGWDEAFRRMAECGDDTLLDADIPSTSEWDGTEWEW